MNMTKTYGLIGLCFLGVLATLDSILGLGGSALIADICRTILEDEPAMGGGMGDMRMEVKPAPIIAISLTATFAAIFELMRDQQKISEGRSEPEPAERAGILSAMLLVAQARGKTTREEVQDIFRIVTSHELEEELVTLFFDRFNALTPKDHRQVRLDPLPTSIGKRRALAAALMIGCVGRSPDSQVSELIEQIALDIDADASDIAAARHALSDWQKDYRPLEGVSPVSVLRHRNLALRPA
ncbi:MAG: hypothetical protein QNJ20_01285 [Paracoccaceae bacterium]|nr:hypothetical protein [Paracoccaceae bacterium]